MQVICYCQGIEFKEVKKVWSYWGYDGKCILHLGARWRWVTPSWSSRCSRLPNW